MSILIRSMGMPKSCSVCPMLEGDRMDGLCHAASKWLDDDEHWTWYVYPEGDMDDSKPCNCPLGYVPPHGRLIDADALVKSDRMVGKMMMFGGEYVYTQSEIDRAPTIIEAEGET